MLDYARVRGIARAGAKAARALLALLVAKTVGLAFYFSVLIQTGRAAMPLGLLIYGISGIDCALVAYRAEKPHVQSLLRYTVYCLFFPRIFTGPLMPSEAFFGELERADFQPRTIAAGASRFVMGLLKYPIMGAALYRLYLQLRGFSAAEESVLSVWCMALAFALGLYFTLAGMSDLARGMSGMFGITLQQNFYYPMQSRSVTDFFERFNIMYGKFLNSAVMEPLKTEDSRLADCAAILLRGMLWGMWFGFRANFIVFGAFIAVFIALEKYAYPGALERVPTLFCRAYTFFVALCAFVLFSGPTLGASLHSFSVMLQFTVEAAPFRRIMYSLSSAWPLLAAGVFFATNIMSLVTAALFKAAPRVAAVAVGLVDVCAVVAFAAFSLGGAAL